MRRDKPKLEMEPMSSDKMWVNGQPVEGSVKMKQSVSSPDGHFEAVAGLKSVEPITLSGFWLTNEDDPGWSWPIQPILPPQSARKFKITPPTVRLFGVDWFAGSTFEFDATMSNPEAKRMADADVFDITALVVPGSEVVISQPEWWRKAGYLVMARPIDRILKWLVPAKVEPE